MAYYEGELLKQNFGKALNEFEELNVPLSEVAIKIGQTIKNTPTADVVEVKHGKWSYEYSSDVLGGTDATYDWACSVCKEMSVDDTAFCPNCGAKMDGLKNGFKE